MDCLLLLLLFAVACGIPIRNSSEHKMMLNVGLHPEHHLCNKGDFCMDSCDKNKTHGCIQVCRTKDCNLACEARPSCEQHCQGQECRWLYTSRSKVCIQNCTGIATCPNTICSYCGECHQILKFTGSFKSFKSNEIQKISCGDAVGKCHLYCGNRKCSLYVAGNITYITVVNAVAEIHASTVVKKLHLNCSGVKSRCTVLSSENSIPILQQCKQNCGIVILRDLKIDEFGKHPVDEEIEMIDLDARMIEQRMLNMSKRNTIKTKKKEPNNSKSLEIWGTWIILVAAVTYLIR